MITALILLACIFILYSSLKSWRDFEASIIIVIIVLLWLVISDNEQIDSIHKLLSGVAFASVASVFTKGFLLRPFSSPGSVFLDSIIPVLYGWFLVFMIYGDLVHIGVAMFGIVVYVALCVKVTRCIYTDNGPKSTLPNKILKVATVGMILIIFIIAFYAPFK